MRASSHAHLLRAFRDKALVDREGKNCGMVDDIETEELETDLWQLTALLVGPGAWRRRRPRWFTALLPGDTQIRIAAADVASATSVVRLLKRADELGLAETERRLLGWWRGKRQA